METPSILAFEPDRSNRQLLQAVLDRKGYRATLTETEEEALAAFRGGTPDLVIVNLASGQPDDLSLLQRLHEEATAVPIVALTTSPEVLRLSDVVPFGVRELVDIPFNTKAFTGLLASIIEHEQAERRVLIVDDEPDIVRAIAERLQADDYHTIEGASGTQAITQVFRHRPRLLILDVLLPDMNGYRVLHEIRRCKAEDVRAIPVIMLTALSAQTDVFRGYREGADYYITKPFHMDAVVDAVTFFLGDLSPEERREIERRL